ncbi:MAG: hypothetical protein ABEJ56_01735 [Candidatus Nanohaloarchaea archaeon]
MSQAKEPLMEVYNGNRKIHGQFDKLNDEYIGAIQSFIDIWKSDAKEVMGDVTEVVEFLDSHIEEVDNRNVLRSGSINRNEVKSMIADEQDAIKTVEELKSAINEIENKSEAARKRLNTIKEELRAIETDLT